MGGAFEYRLRGGRDRRLRRRARARTATFAVLVALAAILAVAGCGGDSDDGGDEWVLGSWQGRLHQAGMAPFQVWATVDSAESASGNSVRYSGLDCRGTWTPLGGDEDTFRFREVIDSGRSEKCKGAGTVTLVCDGDDRARYSFRGGGVESRGTLSAD